MQAVLLSVVLAVGTPRVMLPPESARCMGCHERVSLVRADTLGGGWAALNPESYLQGSHGSLSCAACHGEGLSRVPHDPGPHMAASCMTCHSVDPTGCSGTPMAEYQMAALGDVHLQVVGNGFTCASCHDPHTASLAPCADVHESNSVCLTCHRGSEVLWTHYWLPSAGLHLRRTGCTACHFPAGGPGSTHYVLPKAAALSDCRACHDRRRATAQYPGRSASWGRRVMPGWRSTPQWELAVAAGVVVVIIAARFLRIGVPALGLVRPGPSGIVRICTVAALLVSGVGIYAGAGRALDHLSHLHVAAGALLLAAYAERVLLYSRQRRLPPPRTRWVRWVVLSVVMGSGLALVAPTFTSALDAAVPTVREIHRNAAAVVGLWVLWSLLKRSPPGR